MHRLPTLLIVVLALGVAGCSGSQRSLTSPSSVALQTSAASDSGHRTTSRIVDDLPPTGGGPEFPAYPSITGRLTLESAGGSLTATYPAHLILAVEATAAGPEPRDFRNFVVTILDYSIPGLPLSGTGRFADFEGWLTSFSVTGPAGGVAASPNQAHVFIYFPAAQSRFAAQGAGVPNFDLQQDAGCTSGFRLTTTVRMNLEYFGNTLLTDTHCAINP